MAGKTKREKYLFGTSVIRRPFDVAENNPDIIEPIKALVRSHNSIGQRGRSIEGPWLTFESSLKLYILDIIPKPLNELQL